MSKRTHHESRAFALLQSANPARVEDIRRELDEERLATAWAHACAVLEGNPEVGVGRPAADGAEGRAPRDARRVRLVGAAGAVAVAAAVAVALTGLPALLPGGGEPARALQVLNAAASIAAAQPAPSPGPGEYTYLKRRGGLIGGPSETVEWWIAADGSGRMRRTGPQAIGVISYADGRRRQLPATIERRYRTARDVTFGPGRFAELYEKVNPGVLHGRIDELPIDPKVLEAELGRTLRETLDFNPDPDTQSLQMLQLIEQILAYPLAPPKLRSSVYEIAAGLEAVEISEHVTDPVGRPATAIALCSAAIPARYEVFFDPATSATLGTREFDLASCDDARSHGSSGLIGYNVYLKQGTVDSVHEQP
jgi:hypothetical protein